MVKYDVAVELRFRFLQGLTRLLFDERQTAEATVNAFQRRGRQIYGGAGQVGGVR